MSKLSSVNFSPSNTKNQYIHHKRIEMKNELLNNNNIQSITNDAQFEEITEAITTLHAHLEYNVEFEINNTLQNLQYNLPIEFNTPCYGLIHIQSDKSLIIEENLVINSYETIYKTSQNNYINPLKIINISTSGIILEIHAEGNFEKCIDFFASQDILNSIFGPNEEIKIKDMYEIEYKCTLHSTGNIHAHCSYNFLSYFRIWNINNENITNKHIFKIPMFKPKNLIPNSIYTNCAIVINQFNSSFVINNNIISANPDYNIVKIQSVYDKEGNIIPSIKESPNGWYINRHNNCWFMEFKNINNTEAYVDTVCENETLNTRFCKFQNHMPINTEWKILPKKNNINNKSNMFDILTYTTSNAEYICKKLMEACHINIISIKSVETVINTYFKDNYIPLIGREIRLCINNPNFILLRAIEKNINQYHIAKLIVEEEETGVTYDQINPIIEYNL